MGNLEDVQTFCTYCHKSDSKKLYDTTSTSGDIYVLRKCLCCRGYFISPTPSKMQLNAAYDDFYYGERESKFSSSIEKILGYFRSQRVRTVRRYVDSPGRVLDIGCGNGQFLQGLINKNYECYGIELFSKSAVRAAKVKGLDLKIGRLSIGDFREDSFDAVSMWHVFEHLSEPRETLQIIDKILKVGGYLFLSLPNIESFQSKFFKGHWLHLDPPRHLLFFSAHDLKKIMEENGFSLVKVRYFSLEYNPFGMQQSLLNSILKKREVLFEVLKGNNKYAKEYQGLSILLQKAFYISTFPFFALLSLIEAYFKRGGTMEMVFKKIH